MPDFIIDDNGCWLWQRAINNTGYGAVSRGGRKGQPAHRVYFEDARGPIPAGLVLDHLCEVRHCVNPDHLQVTTQARNVRRSRAAKLTAVAVAEIRDACARGTAQSAVAALHGVHQSQVSRIVNHERWAVA